MFACFNIAYFSAFSIFLLASGNYIAHFLPFFLRQTELNSAFDSSMKYAMQLLQLEEGAPQTEEEWKIMFVDSLRIQIKGASDLEVNILYADMEKGILSAEAILHFTHPNGERAMVSKSGTIYLEEYEADTSGS